MSNSIENVDLDLSGTQVSRPLFADQVIRCRTGEVKIETEEDGRKNLLIPLIFEAAATTTDGRTVQPGFQHTDRIGLSPTGNRTAQMIKEQVARFQVAALGIKEPKVFDAAETVGKLVDAKFATRADRNDSTKLYQDIRGYFTAK